MVSFGPMPNFDDYDGPVPVTISVNGETMGTTPMTKRQYEKFLEKLPDPNRVYDSATIDRFTNRNYIMQKSQKYNRIDMQQCVRFFNNRPNRNVTVEPTLLTDFFAGKSRVTIEDLITNDPSESQFFLCRTIRLPWIEVAEVKTCSTGLEGNISLVAEDPEGKRTIVIRLWDYPRRRMDDISEEFPVGIVLAFSNAHLSHGYMGSTIDANYSNEVYVDQVQNNKKIPRLIIPTDEMIQRLYPDGLTWHSAIPAKYQQFVLNIHYGHLITTPDGWKKFGNVHYARKHFDEAALAFKRGLELDPKSIVLLSNRAAAFLELKQYEQALNDANEVLNMDSKHVKATVRKAKSLAGLKHYKNCADFIQEQIQCHPEFASNNDLRRLLDDMNAKIKASIACPLGY